jgi:hypothetical protein
MSIPLKFFEINRNEMRVQLDNLRWDLKIVKNLS